MRRPTAVVVVGLFSAVPSPAAAQRACSTLTGVRLTDAVVTTATDVPAGVFTPPAGGMPGAAMTLSGYCRVQGVARPTGDSEIKFEVWLPAASLAGALKRGYATAGTDDGHTGMSPAFAPGHPEVVDFGHRAVHLTAVHAKAVVEAFYGKAPSRSYFFGCSDGGREALMEAQRYPADFNGIVAGAPANNWTRLLTSGVWNWKALTEAPSSAIPATKLGLIQRAVATACDRSNVRVRTGRTA